MIEAKFDHGIQYLGVMNLGAQIPTEIKKINKKGEKRKKKKRKAWFIKIRFGEFKANIFSVAFMVILLTDMAIS